MGYVGNINGSRKSEIAAKLGKDYFGISDLDLAQELEIYLEEERSGEIDTVQIDADGRLFLFFYAPNKAIQKYYLDEHGYKLSGNIKAIINGKLTEIELCPNNLI